MADFDYLLALRIQSEFDTEFKSDHIIPKEKAPRKRKAYVIEDYDDDDGGVSQEKQQKPATLIDPEWEVIDPTPDIHCLFLNFNKRFFWNTLGSVEVRWSPRMYSCAGVCSYQYKSGMCSVRLSEPLLKLRPRSDLVETLLHEMIHAYLFLTNNDRDRDGHGPEFRKHMYRINQTAGTNITIYHSFTEEVKVYQRHWWRCDGPCKNRPPFFGTVRRTMNRAPGPNDFWWLSHQQTCGGNFIKIRDPKMDEIKTKQNVLVPKNSSDIRKYIVTSPKKSVFGINNINESTKGAIKKVPSLTTNPSQNNYNRVTGFKDLIKKDNNNTVLPKRNIFGGSGNKLGDNAKNNKGTFKKPGSGNAVLNKGTGVLTVTSKSKNSDSVGTAENNTFSPFTGKGNVLGSSNSQPVSSLLTRFTDNSSKSRNHHDTSPTVNKAVPGNKSEVSPEKYKDDFFDRSLSDDELAAVEEVISGSRDNGLYDYVHCPVCGMKTHRDDMQIHLQSCDILNVTLESMNNSSTLELSDGEDKSKPLNDKIDPAGAASGSMLPCPCCSKSIMDSDINKHLDECLSLLAIKEFDKDW